MFCCVLLCGQLAWLVSEVHASVDKSAAVNIAAAALHSLPNMPGSSLSGVADLRSRIAEVPGPDLAKSCVPVGR